MKKQLGLFLIVITILLSACNEENATEAGNIAINFKLKYDGAPLVMFDRYEYPNGMEFFFTRFNFYLSNLNISTATGEQILIKDIEFLNLTDAHDTAANAEQGMVLELEKVPLGTYNNLQFDIGVPTDLNGQRPRDYPNDHPLAATGEYWDGWKSYIFSKTEGKLDTDGDGQAELGLAYHIGGDETLRNITLDKAFLIEDGQTTTVVINIEMKRMFDDGNTIYDPLQTAQIHSLTQLDEANILADNLQQSFQ